MTSLDAAVPLVARHPDAPGLFAGTSLTEDVSKLFAMPAWPQLRSAIVACIMEEERTPLGLLLPGLVNVLDDPLDQVRLRERSRNVLLRAGVQRWGDLAPRTVRDVLTWHNAGVTTACDIVGACLDASMETIASGSTLPAGPSAANGSEVEAGGADDASRTPEAGPNGSGGWALTEATRSLRVVAAWASSERSVERMDDALKAAEAEDAPSDIKEALAALGGLPAAALGVSGLVHPDLDALMAELMAGLEPGERTAFERRVVDVGATLEEVGLTMGLTRERVRQLQAAAESKVAVALRGRRFRTVWWRASDLAGALGRAALWDSPDTERAVAHAIRGSGESYRNMLTALLLDLAGPYRERNGWLVRSDLPALSPRDLTCLADPYGLISVDEAFAWLEKQGIRPAFHEAWLAQANRLRREGEMLIVWPRNALDKCVSLLALRGNPADAETLLGLVGEGHNVRGIRARMFEDPRLMRVSRSDWALRDWHLEEYTGIAEEIAQRIEEWGGRAKLNDLIDTLVPLFGVKPISVRTYAQAPLFVIEDGWVRMRREDEPFLPDTAVARCRGVFRTSTGVSVLAAVDHDVLRGSGRPFPDAAAVLLGVLPGHRRAFEYDDGLLTVGWPITAGLGPTMGSTRRLAEGAEARDGDYLRLTFDAGVGSVTGTRVVPDELSVLGAPQALGIVCGVDDLADPETMLAQALDVTPSSVRRALVDRGDDFIASLLPTGHDDEGLGDALHELAEILDNSR